MPSPPCSTSDEEPNASGYETDTSFTIDDAVDDDELKPVIIIGEHLRQAACVCTPFMSWESSTIDPRVVVDQPAGVGPV